MENTEIMETTETAAEEVEKVVPRCKKTLANCTPKEFAEQTAKISNIVKKYVAGVKAAKEAVANGESDVFSIVNYICGDNIDDTMNICGALLFMSGEKFANLDVENGDVDGIAELTEMINSERVMRFFMSAIKLSRITKMLS
jgi:hypothetical protein